MDDRCRQAWLPDDGPSRVLPGPLSVPHPDMESDDIGPAAIVLGSAIIALGALTVLGAFGASCVIVLRKLVCRCPG